MPLSTRSRRRGVQALPALLLNVLLLNASLLGILLVSPALVGCTTGQARSATPVPAAGTDPTGQPNFAAPNSVAPNFVPIVARVKPAVVSITNNLRPQPAEMPSLPPGMFPFPLPFPFPFGMNPGQLQQVEALGSGFIISPSGYIVTNDHVVNGEQSLTVTLDDGVRLPARVVGTDPRADLAVLKVDAGHPLPFLRFGNSSDVAAGQWVLAMGNPFGLGGTVTAGIVSALGRDIGDGSERFIQTDAPINKGNSGGPLFNLRAQVIGVNTAIFSPSGGSVGIGFAIPSNTARAVTASLIAHGPATRG